MTNAKDSAFSFEGGQNNGEQPERGLTKREYFAAMAMQGFCANAESYVNCEFDEVAEMSLFQADALIEELNKESK